MKNHYGDESKAKASIPTSTQDFEPSNKARKDKKKKQYKVKQDSTPAIGVNKVEVGTHKKKKKDVNEIICYKYNKKRYYLDKCLKLQKSKN